MNVRFFAARAKPVWWFGGGMDLTPYYGFEEDARTSTPPASRRSTPFGAGLLPALQELVRRVLLPQAPQRAARHRRHLLRRPRRAGLRHLLRAGALGRRPFPAAYVPIVERRRDLPYGERERDFQAYRRGRYVEFNLVYDRGTLFGLQSGGRTESILMSLPPRADVALRLEARARLAGGEALHRLPQAARLGLRLLMRLARCW